MESKLLLVLGPAGCGKSTLIRRLRDMDKRFVYISPYTTRSLRCDEKDKISIRDDRFDQLVATGEIVIVNELYGARYGTPRRAVEDALASAKFPVVDWPVDRVADIEKMWPGRTVRLYLEPPDIDSIRSRLIARDGNLDESRKLQAERELAALHEGAYSKEIDFRVVAADGSESSVADEVYRLYLEAVRSHLGGEQ